MTDNEIIKALECCQREYDKNCKQCPYNKYSITGCRGELRKDTLDFINRLQAENERLKKENEILSINADTAFQDGLNEAQDLYAKQVKAEIKSEAVREFAERLKDDSFEDKGYYYDIILVTDIDDVLKEMIGETE